MEREVTRLRERLWRAQRRRSELTGNILLISSAVALITAYFIQHLLLELISIIAFFLGVILKTISYEQYVKAAVATNAVTAPLHVLDKLLTILTVQAKAIHTYSPIHPRCMVVVPIHTDAAFQWVTKNRAQLKKRGVELLTDRRGIVVPSTGDGLVELYEKEIGDLAGLDVEYVVDWLPRILVEGLDIAKHAEMRWEDETLLVTLRSAFLEEHCRERSELVICDTLGCPLCSSIGDAIAKSSKRSVIHDICTYNPQRHETTITYQFVNY